MIMVMQCARNVITKEGDEMNKKVEMNMITFLTLILLAFIGVYEVWFK